MQNIKDNANVNIYEGALSELTGETLRPGGLALTKEAIALCQFPKGANVVDVGCGTGSTVRFLIEECGLNAIGIDSSEELVELGKRMSPGLPIYKGNGENLRVRSGEMDGVFMECSLSVMEDVDFALSEAYRVLRDKGKLVLSDVYFKNMMENDTMSLPANSCLIGAGAKETFIELFDEHGFELESWQDKSEWIKQIVADSIMNSCSTDKLWDCILPGIADKCLMKEKIKEWKPGYFLLIAGKRVPEPYDHEHKHSEIEECDGHCGEGIEIKL